MRRGYLLWGWFSHGVDRGVRRYDLWGRFSHRVDRGVRRGYDIWVKFSHGVDGGVGFNGGKCKEWGDDEEEDKQA